MSRPWSSALRYWLISALLLAGCTAQTPPKSSALPWQSVACAAYSSAWVNHFRANVAVVSSDVSAAKQAALVQAKAQLQALVEPENCHKPYCLIQPKAEGRLDSYCGYKVPDPTGQELYRWIDWPD